MKLLTKDLREKLPPLGSTDGNAVSDTKTVAKWFTPMSDWTWYAWEGEPVLDGQGEEVDFRFFGLVDGLDAEIGYFSLREFEDVNRGQIIQIIERDMYYEPETVREAMVRHGLKDLADAIDGREPEGA